MVRKTARERYIRGMKLAWITALVVAIAGCSAAQQPQPKSVSADDRFIEQVSTLAYWKYADRSKAIAGAHAFCDSIADSEKYGNNSIAGDAMSLLVARHGLEPATVFVKAARENYCP